MTFDYTRKSAVKYPSLSKVLDFTMTSEKRKFLEEWKARIGEEVAEQILVEARDKGKALHLLSERFLLNQPLIQDGDTISNEDRKSFNSMKMMLRNITKVYGIETPLYSDILRVNGRADLVCQWKNNEDAIVDFKISRRAKSEDDIYDYKLQTAFYGIAHNEMFGTEINKGIILMVTYNGDPLQFQYKLDDYYEPLIERIEQYYERNN